nr:MAG TPA: hypothetical protein [Caudoviricetes sp.]
MKKKSVQECTLFGFYLYICNTIMLLATCTRKQPSNAAYS